jgi:hypothetical protein
MNQFILWGILLIPGSWLVSLAILLCDEWRARNLHSREDRYLLLPDKKPSNSRAPH